MPAMSANTVADAILRKLSNGAAWTDVDLAAPQVPAAKAFVDAIGLLSDAVVLQRIGRKRYLLAVADECKSEASEIVRALDLGWISKLGQGAVFSDLVVDRRSAKKFRRSLPVIRFDTLTTRFEFKPQLRLEAAKAFHREHKPVLSGNGLSVLERNWAELLALSKDVEKVVIRGRPYYLFPDSIGTNTVPPEFIVCALIEAGRAYNQYWVNGIYAALGYSDKPARTSFQDMIRAGLITPPDSDLTRLGRLAGQTVLMACPDQVASVRTALKARRDRRIQSARENGQKSAALQRPSTKG